MDSNTSNQVGFHALPDGPFLTHSWCGYALLTLEGLSPVVTKDQVQRVTVQGIDHKFRPMGDQTLMLIPSFFPWEAQRVVLHLTPSPATEAPKTFKAIRAGVALPDLSMGLTAPNNRHERNSQ